MTRWHVVMTKGYNKIMKNGLINDYDKIMWPCQRMHNKIMTSGEYQRLYEKIMMWWNSMTIWQYHDMWPREMDAQPYGKWSKSMVVWQNHDNWLDASMDAWPNCSWDYLVKNEQWNVTKKIWNTAKCVKLQIRITPKWITLIDHSGLQQFRIRKKCSNRFSSQIRATDTEL